MAQLIIAISREFGSGGHEIATKIAEKLDIPMYDRNMLDHMAEKNNMDAEQLHKFDEHRRIHGLTRTVRGYSSSPEEHIANLQFDFIKEKAASGESFVVVGRCAEDILKGNPGLISIFIRGDMPAKIERVEKLYNLSEADAKYKILRHDKKRKQYHNYYCNVKWGDSRNYDLCVNSSKTPIDTTVEMLVQYIKVRAGLN